MSGTMTGSPVRRGSSRRGATGRARGRWRLAVVLGLPAVLLAAAGIAATPAAAGIIYGLGATISVGDDPDAVAVDPVSQEVYVTNSLSHTVSAINEFTNTVDATIDVGAGSYPDAVGVDPGTTDGTVYVGDLGNGTVSVIDEATNTVTATINAGTGPGAVGVDPATDTVYVANEFGNTVSVIDGATNTVTATIGVGNFPTGVAVNPATNTVYVAAEFGAGTLSVIDGATNTVTATITLGTFTDAVGVNPVTNTLYVAIGSGTLSVIDGATNTVTATIGVGGGPVAVGVDPATNTVYVSNEFGFNVSVIDGATHTLAATVGVGSFPAAVGVDTATHLVYVANQHSDTVSVITPVPDTDLAIAQPASITTDAIGPSGATVTYPAPAVTDGDDANPPAASCTPASGTVFPIGTTTVKCAATDSDDTPSTVTTSFTITVNGAAAQLAALLHSAQGVGPGTSLADKVATAQSDLAVGDTPAVCADLTAFINEVQAQSRISIPPGTAAELITEAMRIRAVLAC